MNGYKTYYWESARGAEADFIIQRDGQLIPVEVKSADNTKAKSLKVYMDIYHPAYAIKLSTKNFAFKDHKKTVPLYAAFCIWNPFFLLFMIRAWCSSVRCLFFVLCAIGMIAQFQSDNGENR